MADLDTPKLRPGLQVMAGPEPGTVVLIDQLRLGGPLQLSRAAFDLIRLFDGCKSLAVLQAETAIMFGGEAVPLETLANLIEGLEQEFFLESPRLLDRLRVPDRPPVCIGCYDADPDLARKQLRRLVHRPRRAGPARGAREPGCDRRPRPRRPPAAHGLSPRRHHVRLGIQGAGRADPRLAVRDRRHVALLGQAVLPHATELLLPARPS